MLSHGSVFRVLRNRIVASYHAMGARAKRRVRRVDRVDCDALARACGLSSGEARALQLVDADYRERLARAFQAAGGLHAATRLQHADASRRLYVNRNEAARIGRVFWLQWAPDSEFEDVRTEDLILDDDGGDGTAVPGLEVPPEQLGHCSDETPLPVSRDRWVTPLFDAREVKI